MSEATNDSLGVEQEWREPVRRGRQTRLRVFVRRTLVATLCVLAIAALIIVLLQLVSPPRTHLMVLHAAGLAPLSGPTTPVAGHDLALLASLQGVARWEGPEQLDELFDTPSDLEKMDGVLKNGSVDTDDTLIVYVAAHGITRGEQAYLVCNNFDPSDPENGLCPVRSLLKAIDESPAKVKLLILDAGRIDYDPRLGIVANNFPSQVQAALSELDESRLFVLCSHGDLERSHRSLALDGSVFGVFVAKGLQGAADTEGDADGVVDLAELKKFVTDKVSSWIHRSSAGAATQVPHLYRGGDNQTDNTPALALLNVAGLSSETRTLDVSGNTRLTNSTGPPRGFLAHLTDAESESVQPAGAVSADAEAATNEPAAATENDSAGDQGEAPRDPREQIGKLLASAWRIRDQLSSSEDGSSRFVEHPVDSTPHLWREMQEELIAYEQAIQGGASAGTIPSVENLRLAIAKFTPLKDGKPLVNRDMAGLRATGELAAPRLPVELTAVRSLALASLLAKEFSSIDAKRVDELQQLLNGLIEAAPDDLVTRLSALQPTPEFRRYYELRLVTQLGDVASSQPALAQLALQVRRDGEQVATNGGQTSRWLDGQLREADHRRLAGERQMLDQIGTDWPLRAKRELEAANRLYRLAAEQDAEIEQANHLRNELVFRAPYYLRMLRESGQDDADFRADRDALQRFFDELRELADLLDDLSPSNVDQVKQLQISLRAFDDNMISGLRGENAWRMEELLETPLPTHPERVKLIRDVRQIGAGSVNDIESLDSPPEQSAPNFDRQIAICRLEIALARLAEDVGAANGKVDDSKFDLPNPGNPDRAKLQALGADLESFYSDLPTRLTLLQQSPANVSYVDAHQRAVSAKRALQLLDARDAHEFRDISVNDFSRNVDLYDVLIGQARRFELATADAPADEAVYLSEAASYYEGQAAEIFSFANASIDNVPQLEIHAPDQIGLVIHPDRSEPISVSYQGVGKLDVWVVLEYDPELLEVDAPPNVYHEEHLAGFYPYRPDLVEPAHPPTWSGIQSGDASQFNLRVRSLPGAGRSARMYVKAIARSAAPSPAGVQSTATNTDDRDATAQVRHAIDVPLRQVDVVLDAPLNSWEQLGDKFVLRTFPNHLTDYRFGVVNHGRIDREVALRFFIPPAAVNLAELSEVEAKRLVSRLSPAGQLTIAAAADGEIHFASAAEPPPAANAVEPVPSPTVASAVADEGVKPPAGPSVNSGMIVEVSDPKSPAETSYKQLDIVSQRPRSYVRPQVSYNARLERIEVIARPRSAAMLPNGPVKIACDIADDTDTAAEGKLQDVIVAPRYEAKLFVNVPANPPREVTLYLDVDDYPRAFIYRVPCGSGAVDLAEETNVSDVRIRKVVPSEFQPPAAVTQVVVQVDSPVGAFDAEDDYLRTALDENMDQQFGPELGLRFDSDRQANAYLSSLAEDGVLTLDTRVSDHQIPLATEDLQNVFIQVNGQTSVDGRQTAAEPITLKIDGVGPKIQHVVVSPWGGFVIGGTDLDVTVVAADSMSGVKQVEVGFDVDGSGEFSAKLPPISAVVDPATVVMDPQGGLLNVVGAASTSTPVGQSLLQHRWVATLPTKEIQGVQTLLVRAVDQAGNWSEYYSKRIQILTAEQAAEKVQQQAKVVAGTVVFRGRPVPGAEIALFAVTEKPAPAAGAPAEPALVPQDEQVASSKAGEDGNFALAGVTPGKYRLSAEGVIRNKPRFGEREVLVELTPGGVIRADLQLE